ncbi:MAG TPA: LuxR C-terminal-related transcriptional regulator [Acidimicrobiales bacterium]
MLVGRSGLSPVMVGRSAELGRRASLLSTLKAPEVALISGEAGIGKTRLVQELVEAVPPGTPVLAGQADPGSLGRPFELLLDALGDVVPDAAALPGAFRDLAAGRLPLDGPVGQALAGATGPPGRAPVPQELIRLGVQLVRKATSPGPGLVVFEDLHWADGESIALFERLAEPDGHPVLLVGTYRPEKLSRRHPASELLPRLERRHSVTHLRLERLTAADVAAFVHAVYGRPASFRVVEALHGRTGGNPFFLEELLASAGDVTPEELCEQPLPWSLAEAIRTQLEDLSPRERRIVEAAAVLGRRVAFDLLAAVTGADEDELIGVLRDLVARGLVVEAENDVFSFRHALAREAVAGDLLGRERRRLHEAALDALNRSGSSDLAAVAYHANGAGRYADMVDAARRGSARYLARGSTYQALRLAELGLTEADDDLVLLETAARAAWLLGLVGEALAHAERWRAVASGQGAVEGESAALRMIVRLRWELAEVDAFWAGTEELRALVDRMERGEERSRAMAQLAQAYMLADHPAEAIEWAGAALEAALADGPEDVVLQARVEEGSALINQPDRVEEGAAMLRQVADEAEERGFHVLVTRALHNLVLSETQYHTIEEAARLLERMRAAAEKAGYEAMAGAAYAQGRCDLAERAGDLRAARRYLSAGQDRAKVVLRQGKQLWYSLHEALLATEDDALDEAAAVLASVEAFDGRQRSAKVAAELLVAARRGDLTATRAALDALLRGMRRGWRCDATTLNTVVAVGCRAGLGTDRLRDLLDGASEPHGVLEPLHAVSLVVAKAELAACEGRNGDALALLGPVLAESPSPLPPAPLATAHLTAARCLLAEGRPADARTHAETADRLLASWGGWRRDEAHAVLRRLGKVSGPLGPDVLTPREREVVALLAEGLTNAELADRLFISPRTAAVHVSNILAKLGMASRTEVAAWAVRTELATSTAN